MSVIPSSLLYYKIWMIERQATYSASMLFEFYEEIESTVKIK